MTLPLTAGSRAWHKNYTNGVRAGFDPEETTWTAMMTQAFDTFSDQDFIEYYGTTYTYADMRGLAARVCAALRARGIGKGDRVALHLPNCPWHPIFFFGILAAGAAVTHLSPLDADREIAHKLSDSGAKLVVSLTTPEFAHHFKSLLASGETPDLVQCPDPGLRRGAGLPDVAGCGVARCLLGRSRGRGLRP